MLVDFAHHYEQPTAIQTAAGAIIDVDNQGAEELYLAVRARVDAGHRSILLNLAQVGFIDSTGLGRLIASMTRVSSRAGRLKLLSPSPKVEDVLKITGTDVLFEIFDDEEQALASFDDSEG